MFFTTLNDTRISFIKAAASIKVEGNQAVAEGNTWSPAGCCRIIPGTKQAWAGFELTELKIRKKKYSFNRSYTPYTRSYHCITTASIRWDIKPGNTWGETLDHPRVAWKSSRARPAWPEKKPTWAGIDVLAFARVSFGETQLTITIMLKKANN